MMDARLLKALSRNRISIVGRCTAPKAPLRDDPTLIERCQDLSFHETEAMITESGKTPRNPTARKNLWAQITRLLNRSVP